MFPGYRYLARSEQRIPRMVRAIHRWVRHIAVPAPAVVVRPLLWVFLLLRAVYHESYRILVCEPLFKAYCKRYGRRVHTGVFIHWIQGKGDILLGDDVHMDGKCTINFATRFCDNPTLSIGDRTGVSHACTFTVGKRITIGKDCRIASNVFLFDSSGHATDPEARKAGCAPQVEEVKPITIGDNVWIGKHVIIFPGVTIGDGSIISAGSVVMSDVQPYTVVAGNPARRIGSLERRGGPAAGPRPEAAEVAQVR
jgi:acetyltransferase-like isoleucine patch superfamily enzyme